MWYNWFDIDKKDCKIILSWSLTINWCRWSVFPTLFISPIAKHLQLLIFETKISLNSRNIQSWQHCRWFAIFPNWIFSNILLILSRLVEGSKMTFWNRTVGCMPISKYQKNTRVPVQGPINQILKALFTIPITNGCLFFSCS